jgi:hypothetical protein
MAFAAVRKVASAIVNLTVHTAPNMLLLWYLELSRKAVEGWPSIWYLESKYTSLHVILKFYSFSKERKATMHEVTNRSYPPPGGPIPIAVILCSSVDDCYMLWCVQYNIMFVYNHYGHGILCTSLIYITFSDDLSLNDSVCL